MFIPLCDHFGVMQQISRECMSLFYIRSTNSCESLRLRLVGHCQYDVICCYVVLGKSCSQAKHTAAHALPGQKMPLQVWPRQQMPKAIFSQPYITIYVYEKN